MLVSETTKIRRGSKERECAYVVERDDAVLGNERAHLQLVGGDVPAEGVRGEGQVVCKNR